MTLTEKLSALQSEYVIPKAKYNDFSKFYYRNIEDMLAALKPLLTKYGLAVTFSETIHLVGDRFYIVSVATLRDKESTEIISATSYTREAAQKKGMDEAQISGSTTSYARKSALAGLLAVDSGDRDPDSQDNSANLDAPQVGTNGLTALKMLDDIDLAKPGYIAKMCAAKGVDNSTELSIEYIEKAWTHIVKPKQETINGNI